MTPIQYLVSQLVPVIQNNNPGASSDEVAFATQIVGMYLNYILPNLQVNLSTGAITFVVPSN